MKKLLMSIALFISTGSYANDGSLDPSFGTGGLVTTDLGGGDRDEARASLLQPDGKIVALGQGGAFFSEFTLARYNPDGSLDGSFGTGGLVTTDFGGIDDHANAGLLQPDGKIIALGQFNSADFALARYNPDGSLDTSFGTGGLVTTDFGGTDEANAGLLQPDGKIVAIGQGIADNFALARYNPDGSLDTSFGTGGLVTTDFGGTDIAFAGLLQPDNKIVAIGRNTNSFGLARYNPDGSLDTSFGTGGLVTTDFGNTDIANSGLLQPDGKIVAIGDTGNNSFGLARYNPDGSLDTSFGTAGLVTTDFDDSSIANSGLLQPDGKIVALGRIDSTFNFGLARYNPDGSLDPSFGTGGIVTTDFGNTDFANASLLQPDGKIVAIGKGDEDFALARYLIPSIEVSSLARDLRAKYFLLQ